MDFEEQLEKAEKLSAPSLVGASLRSADDSAHQNYIHPEKSKVKKLAPGAIAASGSTSIDKLTASLDDLINEGALLGSEENFDSYLDTDGNVIKSEFPKRPASHADIKAASEPAVAVVPPKETAPVSDAIGTISASTSAVPTVSGGSESSGTKPFYKQSGDYSTPNLSEYQLANEITDHADLLANIQSHDPHRLPADGSKLPTVKTPTNESFRKLAVSSPASDSSASSSSKRQQNLSSLSHESIHSPYFYTDSTPVTHSESVRSRSRSRSRNPPGTPHAISQPSAAAQERSRSRSNIRPHLARGDSYKLTHDDEPSKYELPADFTDDTVSVREDEGIDAKIAAASSSASAPEEEEDDRRSRASRPTMGELIAAAEKELGNQDSIQSQLLRDPSLVTTGDYTNYNVDTPVPNYNSDLAKERLLSSVLYLRSISRSRSRQPQNVSKDDATLKELVEEGALISDDPYSTIDQLDSLVQNVLTKDAKADESASLTQSKEASLTKSEEASLTKSEDASLTKSEEASLTKSEDASLTKSEEASLTKSEEASLTKSEEASLTQSKEAISSKSEEVDDSTDSKSAADQIDDLLDQLKGTKEVETSPAETETDDKAQPVAEVTSEEVDEQKTTGESEAKEGSSEESEPSKTEPEVEVTPEAAKELKEIKKEEADEGSKKKEEEEELDYDTMEVSPEELRAHLEKEPIYIFTSLAGGMQIMPRTNRLVTILNANQIKFTYRDLGTDEAAKKIWRTYSKGLTLPGIVRGDDFIGNWQTIEEANEEYRLRELLYETL